MSVTIPTGGRVEREDKRAQLFFDYFWCKWTDVLVGNPTLHINDERFRNAVNTPIDPDPSVYSATVRV